MTTTYEDGVRNLLLAVYRSGEEDLDQLEAEVANDLSATGGERERFQANGFTFTTVPGSGQVQMVYRSGTDCRLMAVFNAADFLRIMQAGTACVRKAT